MTLIWQSTAVLSSVIVLLVLAGIADIAEQTRERNERSAHPYADVISTHDWNRAVVQYRPETPKPAPATYGCEFCGVRNHIGQACIGCGHPQTGAARTQ